MHLRQRLWQCNYFVVYFLFFFCSHFYNFISVCWRRWSYDVFEVKYILHMCLKVSDETKRSCRFNRYVCCIYLYLQISYFVCECACCAIAWESSIELKSQMLLQKKNDLNFIHDTIVWWCALMPCACVLVSVCVWECVEYKWNVLSTHQLG